MLRYILYQKRFSGDTNRYVIKFVNFAKRAWSFKGLSPPFIAVPSDMADVAIVVM